MTALFTLGLVSVWSATRLQPGTFLTPLSWPLIAACIWLALLHLRPRLDAADKRQAMAGLLSCAMLLVFLLQDGEFTGWGDVYYFCGPHMQYCTCAYRWNLAGWNKAIVLWGFVLTTALGVQRLLVQLVLQGLLPGEEVVTRESFISICWRLIPYWLNAWEQQWGAECSSMTFELPQFAVELLIILPCVQIMCSRMKVLAMPSVNAALPRGWDGASADQIQQAFVPNVQRGCWERRPEQRNIWTRLKANRHVTAFAALLCLLACSNSLFVPLHLEDVVLTHPRTAAMQAVGRLPQLWGSASDLGGISSQLQDGSLNMTLSFVTNEALTNLLRGKRPGLWRLGNRPIMSMPAPAAGAERSSRLLGEGALEVGLGEAALTNRLGQAAAASSKQLSSFAAWMGAVERGPWRDNSTWAAVAVAGLQQGLSDYMGQCSDAHRFQHNAWKHHYDIFRMQDPNHRLSIPLIEAALALMRLSTEKFFVLLSLYVAFLLFKTPPPAVARLIGLNARISNAFARLVLYSFPCVCWVYGAGITFSTLVSLVFWGGPLWQVYVGLRTHACTVTVKGLRPATATEIERMHNDCAICWCPMTTPGADRFSPAGAAGDVDGDHTATGAAPPLAGSDDDSSGAGPSAGASAPPAAPGDAAGSGAATGALVLDQQGPAGPETAGAGGRGGVQGRSGVDLGDSDGSTLPCGHCYHQTCLTQWLQQCHGQGTAPTCPMCQARMQLAVKWHLWKALFAPSVWQLPARRRGRLGEEGGAEGLEQAAPALPAAHNNYLLRHNPRLAELLADMPQFLAPENVQLLADVQDLRWQRQQLANELQLRQQQLQRLEGRHHQMEVRLELQRQQLLNELHLLAQQLHDQQQQQEQQQQHRQQLERQRDALLASQRQRQQQQRQQQERQQDRAVSGAAHPAAPPGTGDTLQPTRNAARAAAAPASAGGANSSAGTSGVGGPQQGPDGNVALPDMCSSRPVAGSVTAVAGESSVSHGAGLVGAATASTGGSAGSGDSVGVGSAAEEQRQQGDQQQQQQQQPHPVRWRWGFGRRH